MEGTLCDDVKNGITDDEDRTDEDIDDDADIHDTDNGVNEEDTADCWVLVTVELGRVFTGPLTP